MAQQRQAEKDIAHAGQEAARRMSGQAANTARTMAETAELTARTGVDLMQRNSEQVRQTFEAGSEAAARVAERAIGQFARLFGVAAGDNAQQTAHQSARNVETILQSSTILADGVQAISREWLAFVQNRAERNMDRFEALAGSKSVPEFIAAQTDLLRDHLEDFLQTTKRIAEVSTKMVDEAAQTGESTLAPR